MTTLLNRELIGGIKRYLPNALTIIAMFLVFGFYANLRWTSEMPAFEKAKIIGDTSAYLRVSWEEFFSQEFWANTRAPIYPLLFKVYHAEKIKIAAFQAVFSIFAWGTLATATAFSLKSFLRPIAFVLVLVFSLEQHIAGWDVVMLSESLSVSLLALFLAAWLWLIKKWSWGKVIFLGIISFFWAFTRDTNSWVLLMIAGMIAISLLFFNARRHYLLIAIMFLFLFLVSNLSAEVGNRWVYPFQNVLTRRILTNDQALNFFADCGMPITPTLLSTAGGNAESEDRALYLAPELEPYRQWMYAKGKSCYIRWLLSQPLKSIYEPWKDITGLLAFEEVSRIFPQKYQPLLPWYVEYIIYLKRWLLWWWGAITIAALVAIWNKAWKTNKAWVVFIGMSLLIYPHIFLIWHGDIVGTDRHALTASLQFVMSFWLFCLLFLESILTRLRVPGFVDGSAYNSV